jgi:probable rRNA maturation factor
MLEAEDQPPSTIEVLVTDAEGIRELNAEFRGIDLATDVLSFPAGEGPESERLLGEVAVCLPIAEEQAAERGISLESEVACLAVHGGLHLLGYDDATDEGRREMIDKMNAIVSSCGMQVRDEWASIYKS